MDKSYAVDDVVVVVTKCDDYDDVDDNDYDIDDVNDICSLENSTSFSLKFVTGQRGNKIKLIKNSQLVSSKCWQIHQLTSADTSSLKLISRFHSHPT